MELKKSHREALLHKLNEVNEAIDLNKSISLKWLNAKTDDGKASEHVVDWHDIDLFMLQQQKKLIETSIADNNIDF